MVNQKQAIQLTAELRWFFDHPLPFATCLAPCAVDESPARHDFYLRGVGKRLGIKWREGSLEIKQQQGDPEVYQHQEVVGYLEHWKKWSFPLAEREDFNRLDDWLAVTKCRYLARFTYCADTQTVTPAAAQDEAANRCTLEYTHLVTEGQAYYTVGLEASGEAYCLTENLQQTIHYLTENTTLEKLGLELPKSSNYAQWIQERTTCGLSVRRAPA